MSSCLIHWVHWFLEHRIWLLKLLVRDTYTRRWNVAVDCGDVRVEKLLIHLDIIITSDGRVLVTATL